MTLKSELADWSEQYQFQFDEGVGANYERPERREQEPKLRGNDPPRESRGERSSPSYAAPRGNGDDEEESRGTEASAIRRQPDFSMQSTTGGSRAKEADKATFRLGPNRPTIGLGNLVLSSRLLRHLRCPIFRLSGCLESRPKARPSKTWLPRTLSPSPESTSISEPLMPNSEVPSRRRHQRHFLTQFRPGSTLP